jgi:hypothetical protein
MTLPFRGSMAVAWDTVMNDKQKRASNQRIETIPQEVSRLYIFIGVFAGAAEGSGRVRTIVVRLVMIPR